MAKPQLDKILISMAGEYLVAGQLSLKGFVASLMLKNYPSLDIFWSYPKND